MRAQTIILLTLCATLSGCQSYTPVTIAVTNTKGEPVIGAAVQVAPMYFFNPTNKNFIIVGPYDILEPFPAKGDADTTDELGRVHLKIVSKSPFEINIYAESFQPWKGQIAITEQGSAEISAYPNKSTLSVTTVEQTENKSTEG